MKEIVKKIEAVGYYVGNHKTYLLVGKKTEFDQTLGANILQNTFSVFFPKNVKYSIEYFTGQIPMIKEFESDEVLLDFIKMQFPLN